MTNKQLVKIYIEFVFLFFILPIAYFGLAVVVSEPLFATVLLMIGSWLAGARTYSFCLKYKNMENPNENINRDSKEL